MKKGAKGKVYLVGAGPGDPGLVTLKAVACLQKADCVIYDALVNESLLRFAPPQSRRVFVGKRGPVHTLEQGDIETLMIREARRGRVVVRLKGGDPFVFGRGGEEAEALSKARIPFEIVPGVTSAIAAPAYAGIPVTHRDFASAITIVTGHRKTGETNKESQTVVFLMGVSTLPEIAKSLTERGRASTTPVAVIEWGTLPRQRTVTATLGTVVDEVRRAGLGAPAVTVVGDVVSLRKKLSWFESRPLFGRRILVTRSREQASDLSRELEALGAEALEVPTIEIRPPASWAALDRAIGSIRQYDWLIFTSVNGVDSFFGRLREKKKDIRLLAGIRIAAIGPATAAAIAARGIRVDSIAEEYRAEGLVKILGRSKISGCRILIPRARQAREVLVKELLRLGAKVTVVEAYQSIPPLSGRHRLVGLLDEGLDLLTFASSSTVENFLKMIGSNRRLLKKIRKIPVASIGPITTKTAKSHRLHVVIQPKDYTIPSLVSAVTTFFRKGKKR